MGNYPEGVEGARAQLASFHFTLTCPLHFGSEVLSSTVVVHKSYFASMVVLVVPVRLLRSEQVLSQTPLEHVPTSSRHRSQNFTPRAKQAVPLSPSSANGSVPEKPKLSWRGCQFRAERARDRLGLPTGSMIAHSRIASLFRPFQPALT